MSPFRILLIRFGSFGDLVLTTPVLINLKIHYPNSQITFLTKERYRSLVAMFDGIDEIRTIPDNMSSFSYLRSLLQLDAPSYDLIIDLHGNPRSWLTRTMTYAQQKLVYPKRRIERNRIVRTKEYPSSAPHTIDLYNSTITELGKYPYSQRPMMSNRNIPDVTHEIPSTFGGENGYICIAPDAAHATKTYPVERFIQIAKELHERTGVAIAWLVTKTNEGAERLLVQNLPQSHLQICTGLPWASLAAVITNAKLTIANDSGVAHLSSAVGTPVIVIFGPTHPSLGFAPKGQFDIVLDVPVWCRPCSLHGSKPCFRDRQYCFEEIDPYDAVRTATAILKRANTLSPALFIDRDGTLIEEKEFLKDPAQVVLTPGAGEALKLAVSKGFRLAVVSNQSGVARGLMTIADIERVNTRVKQLLAEGGVTIDDILYCPEYIDGTVAEFSRNSVRRKPAPGMIEEAVHRFAIDPKRSFVIGDKLDDAHLARTAGAIPVLVRTGYGVRSAQKAAESNDPFLKTVMVANSLAEAVKEISRIRENK